MDQTGALDAQFQVLVRRAGALYKLTRLSSIEETETVSRTACCCLMVDSMHRFVSMYDISKHFVVPWSKGTGCGLSTLMSPAGGQDAQLMLSHVPQ